jgi:hypothetical protein
LISTFQKKENLAIHRAPYLKLSNTQEGLEYEKYNLNNKINIVSD